MKAILKIKSSSLLVLVTTLVLMLLWAPTTFAQEGLTKIADNVYAYVDTNNGAPQNSFGANAGIIIGQDGIVVIDTLISAKQAKTFIEDIRAISDKPIKYVVNTHRHLDHTFGNSEFAKLGAIIISHSIDEEQLVTSEAAMLNIAKNFGLTEKDMVGTAVAYPELTFNDRMVIDLGGQKIELIYAGASHTNDSIIVYVPDKRLMFTGDILFTNYHPFIADGYIQGWVNVLNYLQEMDVVTIVPGHGPLSTKKDLTEMKQYILAFDAKASELCAKSKDIAYIVSELTKALPQRAEGQFLIRGNVELRYLIK